VRAVFAGDQDAQHPGDLLLACRSSVEPAANFGEAVVDVRPEVGKVFSHRVEHAIVLLPELPAFPPYLRHVAICAAGQHPGGCSVLLAVAHPFIQLAHMLLWRRNASLEIAWLSHSRQDTD
jgi:hypothetical protein